MKLRIKRLQINPEAFVRIMMTGTTWRVSIGVPQDGKLRGVFLDPSNQNIIIFVESKEFDLVETSEVFPFLETEFVRVR